MFVYIDKFSVCKTIKEVGSGGRVVVDSFGGGLLQLFIWCASFVRPDERRECVAELGPRRMVRN